MLNSEALIRSLFQDRSEDLLALAGEPQPEPNTYILGVNYQTVGTSSDAMAIPIRHHERGYPILFVRLQTEPPSPHFLIHYMGSVSLYLSTHTPQQDWLGLIIYVRQELEQPWPPQLQEFQNNSRIRAVYLDALDPALVEASLPIAILGLLGTPPEQMVERVTHLLERTRTEIEDTLIRGENVMKILKLALPTALQQGYDVETLSDQWKVSPAGLRRRIERLLPHLQTPLIASTEVD